MKHRFWTNHAQRKEGFALTLEVNPKKGGKAMHRFLADESGQGMTEYGLIIALVVVVVIGALTLLGGNLSTMFTNAANAVK